MLGLLNEPSFLQNIGDKGVRTEADAREHIRTGPVASYDAHGFGLYLVSLRDTGEPIGTCGLLKRDALDDVDVGFALRPEFWSQGYAFESASANDTKDVISSLKARFPSIHGPDLDDICYATQNRQNAVRDMARDLDLLLVVGAKNSSNSNRLREVGWRNS